VIQQTGQTEAVMRDYWNNTGTGASRAVWAAFGEKDEHATP
jgi:hypothetical protein